MFQKYDNVRDCIYTSYRFPYSLIQPCAHRHVRAQTCKRQSCRFYIWCPPNPRLIFHQGAERFRILVIGNANAGKTTILRKVCHAQGREPVYLDANGKEVRHVHLQRLHCGLPCSLFRLLLRWILQFRCVSDWLAPSCDHALNVIIQCGEHNIEHQFQYPTAHGFIFHDSRGFEAGGADELNKVKDFIKRRAESQQLGDQLHAIWCAKNLHHFFIFWHSLLRYCITTSNDRGMTQAEMNLFEIGTGNGQRMPT